MAKLKKDGGPKQSGGKRANCGRPKVLNKAKAIFIMVKDSEQEKQVNELKLKLKR